MRSYEAICVFHPESKDERIDAILKKLEDKIKGNGGEVEGIKKWGIKKLAFNFKKAKNIKDGFFVLINFKGKGNIPLELGSYLKVTEDVIRYMIAKSAPEALLAAAETQEGGKVEIEPSMFIKKETESKE